MPLLPGPAQGGGWSKIPVTCEMAGDWLRALLKDTPNKAAKVRLGTHSCKTSLLSMSAKYGLNPTARRFLGCHSAGRDKSMLLYSRDTMSWPISLLEGMLQAINTGEFDPDSGRGGFFIKHKPDHEALSKAQESTSSSAESADEEDVQHSEDEQAFEAVAGSWNAMTDQEEKFFFRHSVSRCIHVISDESGVSVRCGRSNSQAYLNARQSQPLCTQRAPDASSEHAS